MKKLLSLLLAAHAMAADLPLAEAPKPGLQTTTTGPLSLTFKPDGGDVVAVLPKDAKTEVLMSDEAGHQLLRNDFGLVGWAQAGGEGSDDFNPEQLKKREVKYKGQEEDTFSLWYDGALGQAREGIYHEDDDGKLQSGAHPTDSVFDYERILETALKPDGPRFAVLCSSGMSDDYFCLWLPTDAIGGAESRKAPGIGGQTFYMPGNGFVYAISDSAGSSYTEHHREKWALVDGQFKEVEQPYYYIGRENSVYQGRRGTDDDDIQKKPLTLTDVGGQTVATLQPGDQVTLLLRDNHARPLRQGETYAAISDSLARNDALKTSDSKAHDNQLGIGISHGITSDLTLGITASVGREKTNGSHDSRLKGNSHYIGAHAVKTLGDLSLTGGLAYSQASLKGTRHITNGYDAQSHAARIKPSITSAYAEGKYTLHVNDHLAWEPKAILAYNHLKTSSVNENGSGGLTIASRGINTVDIGIGQDLTYSTKAGSGELRGKLSLDYIHTSGEKDLQARFNGSDSGFTLRTDKNPNTVRAGLTGEYQTAKGVIIRAGVSDNLRKGKKDLQDTLSVGVKF